MPLLPFSPCDIAAPDTACDFLFDAAELLLGAGAEGLAPFIPPSDCGDTFETYVSMGPPKAEFYDALSIHLVTYGNRPMATRHPTANVYPTEGASQTGVFPLQRAVWSMRLWENQYPGAERTEAGLVVPSPDRLDAVNRHLYAHAMGLYNGFVLKAIQNDLNLPPQITGVTWGDLTSLGPDGTAVGWSFEITTEIG